MAKKPPRIPYRQVAIEDIAHGRFFLDLQSKLARAYRELAVYEAECSDKKGSVKLTATITVSRTGDDDGTVQIDADCKLKVPTPKHSGAFSMRGDRVVTLHEEGDQEDNPRQFLLCDSGGRPFSGVDCETGTVYGDEDEHDDTVAGQITAETG